MNQAYTDSINKLIDQLSLLPGIGSRTAERLAFHILKTDKAEALALAQAISKVKTNITQCKICYNIAESDLCSI